MLLEQLLARLRQDTALNLTLEEVDRAVRQRLRVLRLSDRQPYLRQLLARHDEKELAALIDLLVVPETWFFRDPAVFAAAARLVGERLARNSAPVRILSLPCSTGEEAYTIAMALFDAGMPPSAFSIDAIDLSEAAIAHAGRGLYRDYAFRSQELGFRDRYFTQDGKAYALCPAVRQAVNFSQGNLLGHKPGARSAPYDLIFCRNLLIYFDEPTQRQALREIGSLLAADGWLFTAYAELAVCSQREFVMRSVHDVHALAKDSRTDAPASPGGPSRRRSAPVWPQVEPVAAVSLALASQPRSAVPALSSQEARRLADRGQTDDAVRAYAAILEAEPESSEAAFMMALLSERQARPQLAERYFRRTVYLDPDHYEALCHLALLADRRGDAAAGAAYRHRAARVHRRRTAATMPG